MKLSVGDLVDRYRVEGVLGQGGMAIVYKVRHQELHTAHALKVLTLLSPGLADRLLLEGRIQAKVRHPNIVAVTDALRVDGQPALVMEFIDGPTLDGLMRRFHLSLAQVDDLAQGILAGVAHAHSMGLVHRDLKPGNVLVTVEHGKVVPKVTDFGLAKVLTEDLEKIPRATKSGVTMGTPSFMAPEQFKNARHADGRADVFSLGAVLYELMTGAPAFTGDNMIDLYQAMQAEQYRHVRTWRQGVPDRMISAIEGALKAEPDNRWSDSSQLLEAWRGDDVQGGWTPLSPEPWEPHHIELVQSITKSNPTEPGVDERTPLPVPGPPMGPNPTLTPGTRQLIEANLPPSVNAVAKDPTPAPRRAWLWVASALALLLLISGGLVGTAVVVASWRYQDRLDETPAEVHVDSTLAVVPAAAPEAVPVPVPVPEPESEVAPAPEPVAVSEPLQASVTPAPVRIHPAPPTPVPVPAVVPVPTPVPEPAPAPTRRAGTALVRVSGVERAYLVDASGARQPVGEIDPGTYSLLVFFDPADPTTVLRNVVLAADETREFKCYPGMRICK